MRDKIFDLATRHEGDKTDLPTQFIFMSAAVTDHGPAVTSATKLKQDKKACPIA